MKKSDNSCDVLIKAGMLTGSGSEAPFASHVPRNWTEHDGETGQFSGRNSSLMCLLQALVKVFSSVINCGGGVFVTLKDKHQ